MKSFLLFFFFKQKSFTLAPSCTWVAWIPVQREKMRSLRNFLLIRTVWQCCRLPASGGLNLEMDFEGRVWSPSLKAHLELYLRNGVFSDILLNKDVAAIRDASPPNVNFWAQAEQCLVSNKLLPLPTVSEELRMWIIKSQHAGPRQLRYIWKEWFQKPQTLTSSHI